MTKRASIEFVPCSEVKSPVLKFGGEPFGLPLSRWPKSRSTGESMQFICQIPIDPELFPGTAAGTAFIFMTEPNANANTWEPDGGENAVVIVPNEELVPSLTEGDAPRLTQMVKKFWSKQLVPKACVYTAKLTVSDDPEFIPDNKLMDLPKPDMEAYYKAVAGNKLGGTPGFLQRDELPIAPPWHLLLQLDSTQVPYWINFGDAGIGYAFIDAAGKTGKFLWQCG